MVKKPSSRQGYDYNELLPILQAIKAKEGTVNKIAMKSGISDSTLRDYFLGRVSSYVSVETFEKLKKAYAEHFPALNELKIKEFTPKQPKKKSLPAKSVAVKEPPTVPGAVKDKREALLDYVKYTLAEKAQPLITALELLGKSGLSKQEITHLLINIGLPVANLTITPSQAVGEIKIADILSLANFTPVSADSFSKKDLATTRQLIKNLRQRIQIIIQLDNPQQADAYRQELKTDMEEFFLVMDVFLQLVGSAAADMIEEERKSLALFQQGLKDKKTKGGSDT